MMDDKPIEHAQCIIAQRLLLWAGLSIALGAILNRLRYPLWRGVGIQFILWGTIDGLIALIAGKTDPVHQKNNDHFQITQDNQSQKSKLAILLWANTVMDIFYVIGGIRLFKSKGGSSPYWRGQGAGITIQGGYLFLFDLVHAIWLSNRSL
jgi:hypothetical protein